MAKVKGEIIVDIEKCKGCELCIVACPQDALQLDDKINQKGYRYMVKIEDNCTGCENCALVCPDGVIKVYRKIAKKVEKIAEIKNVNQDMTIQVK